MYPVQERGYSVIDTKFSVALHILTMVSENTKVLSSPALATSVGTNPSYIRKIIALLKNARLSSSQQGKSGYALTKEPKEISLLDIYYATQEINQINLFQLHQKANTECPIGKHIVGAMTPILSGIEKQLEDKLSQQTLETVIDNLYEEAKRNKNGESA